MKILPLKKDLAAVKVAGSTVVGRKNQLHQENREEHSTHKSHSGHFLFPVRMID